MDKVIIYGSPSSPPSRSVYWACLIKEHPFEYIDTALDQMGSSAILKAYNATGQVPTLRDGDFSLAEMPAILAYLCEKYGWNDLYPDDLQVRAKVNQYLHFHHSFTRNFSWKLMAPHIMAGDLFDAMGEQGVGDQAFYDLVRNPDKLAVGQKFISEICALIDQAYFPEGSSYLCADQPTIADLACYEEAVAIKHGCLFDYAEYPRIRAWMDEMEKLPLHEPAHRYNLTLGDIQSTPNSIARMTEAITAGVKALEECGITISMLDRD